MVAYNDIFKSHPISWKNKPTRVEAVRRRAENLSIPVLALGAFLVMVFYSLPIDGATSHSIGYDAALAFVSAYAFHLMVIALPEKRRQEHLYITLMGQLTFISNNGYDIIRDLEYVGRCPRRRITEDHIRKVLMAVNENMKVRSYLTERFSSSKKRFAEIAPYISFLPVELQSALQNENQNMLHDVHFGGGKLNRVQNKRLKAGQPLLAFDDEVYTPLSNIDPSFPLERETLRLLAYRFWIYYQATEEVRYEMARFRSRMKSSLQNLHASNGHYVYFDHEKAKNLDYPYWNYPETSHTLAPYVPSPHDTRGRGWNTVRKDPIDTFRKIA